MLDAATFVLVALALIPRARFPGLLAQALRWRHRVGALGAALFLSGSVVPPLGVLGLLLLALYAYLFFLHSWSRGVSPRSVLAGCLVALLWTAPVVALLSAPVLEPPGVARFWVVDAFTKLQLGFVRPVLEAMRIDASLAELFAYFEAVVLFVSEYLFAIVFAVNLALVLLTYELMRDKDPTLPPRLATLSGRLSWQVVLAALAAGLWASLDPRHPIAVLTWQGFLTVGTLSGAWVLHLMSATSPLLRSVFWGLMLVGFLHPIVFTALIGLAVLSSVTDLPAAVRRYTPNFAMRRARLEVLLGALRANLGATALLAVGLGVSAPALRYLKDTIPVVGPPSAPHARPPRVHGATSCVQRVELALPDGTLRIDRFEAGAPGSKGPWTGLHPDEADRACRARGARLCTRDQWAWACSSGGVHAYPHFDHGDAVRVAPLAADCNIGRREELRPRAADGRCHTTEGVHDMAGNAFEWVRLEGAPAGLFGLAGGYHAYDDDMTARCDWVVLAHEAQLGILDLGSIGFRCCE